MDNVPDFVMQGTFNWELFGGYPHNAGDINADGNDDLLIGLRVNNTKRIAIYYATANPSGIPDLTISAPYTVGSGISAWPLGDINGDGRADLVIDAPPFGSSIKKLLIWTGVENPFVTLVETSNGSVAWSATGLGDVNGIPDAGKVRLAFYNIKGQKVKDLINSDLPRGNHKLVWDGKDDANRNAGSGIYFLRLESGGKTSIRKAMLLK